VKLKGHLIGSQPLYSIQLINGTKVESLIFC